MWGDFNPETKTYANDNDSTIKDYLENTWFDGALGSFTDYLADEIFCNDRTIISGDGESLNKETIYGPRKRIYIDEKPVIKCLQINDRFAMGTNVGNVETNGKIAEGKPVGLITADEVMMAGGVISENTKENKSFYLYTGQHYWTMSPGVFSSSGIAYFLSVETLGYLSGGGWVFGTYGVRPVINIGTNVSVSGGNGTSGQPYTLQLN